MGGRSPWGSFLDAACERYKWTFDYVMWEISYVNLMMMLNDSVSIDYDTDDKKSSSKSKNKSNKQKVGGFGNFLSTMKGM